MTDRPDATLFDPPPPIRPRSRPRSLARPRRRGAARLATSARLELLEAALAATRGTRLRPRELAGLAVRGVASPDLHRRAPLGWTPPDFTPTPRSSDR